MINCNYINFLMYFTIDIGDCYSAIAKAHLTRGVRAGHDITTQSEFAQGFARWKGISNVVTMVSFYSFTSLDPVLYAENISLSFLDWQFS